MAGRGSNPLPMFVEGSEFGRDASGKLRTAHTVPIFDSQFRYNINADQWNQYIIGSGSVTYNSTSRGVRLRATTTSGDRAGIQTRRYWRVLPCKAYHLVCGVLFGAGKANVAQRVGWFDNTDGLFFEYDGTTFYVVSRKAGSDTKVAQTSWNMDKMDGYGISNQTLDLTKIQGITIEHVASGLARIRFGLMSNGRTQYVHELHYANEQTGGAVANLQLPIRAEIHNTGTSASTTDLNFMGCAMHAEGEHAPQTYSFGAHSGRKAIAVSTKRPVMSIRPRVSYNGKTVRDSIKPFNISLLSVNNPIFYELVHVRPGNGTLSGSNFTGANAESMALVDYSATGVHGGHIKGAGFVDSGGKNQPPGAEDFDAVIEYLCINASGSTSDILTVNCSGIGGAANVYAAIEWYENP